MTQESDNSHLLSSLKQLYRQLSERILQQRLVKHPPHSAAGDGHDTLAPLSKLIQRLGDNAVSSSKPLEQPKPAVRSPAPKAPPIVSEGIFHELSNYFRRNTSTTSLQPHLADKLCDATRSHINLALNHARSGDKEGAHMHLQLANNALQMAAQHMSEEAYRQFRSELEGRIKAIDDEIR